jgi:hypothetical protein
MNKVLAITAAVILPLTLTSAALAGQVDGKGATRGTGTSDGRGIVHGSGTTAGTGWYVYKDDSGHLQMKRGTGTVSGNGVAFGNGTATGDGTSRGSGTATGTGSASDGVLTNPSK